MGNGEFLHYYSNMRYTAPYRGHHSVLYLIRAETAFALPHMPDGGMQLEALFGQQVLALVSWTEFNLSTRH